MNFKNKFSKELWTMEIWVGKSDWAPRQEMWGLQFVSTFIEVCAECFAFQGCDIVQKERFQRNFDCLTACLRIF